MVDRNMANFNGRLGRIERIRQAGGGFEAQGTLGRSFFSEQQRPRRLRRGLFAPFVLVLLTIVALKSTVYASIGAEAYGERIAALKAGGIADQIGAYVLQADPLTITTAAQIGKYLN
ncbi:hypothetical protein OEZ60_04905 [Defluviimonas sp. WL0024]|uniref:Uncharacterized protein n=2 Tax=Albidovulum TaxID=205889 RepID=A0ABT3J8D9_9RHOB|nr:MULTISPECIES: hypothetical protein [Defluviimonas]MCU9847337.1 hypothetical protein [Defluviimonas sp. WL0024]MCW3783947.1 hypothetical protein [Defluviimonas salinarum]